MSNPPQELLSSRGYFLSQVNPPPVVRSSVETRNWNGLDEAIRQETLPGGMIFDELRTYAEFSEIDFIISIRSSLEYPDEDGIWHDDGSRLLAFSLSLTPDHLGVEGGRLEIRKRGFESAPSESITTPPFGTMIVFSTGQSGFEHKINRVTQGERIIIAGWCT
jgi:hypothetical protein